MRELEFLPEWYPRVRRRKRLTMLHGWMTIVIVCGLCLWMLLAHRNVRAAQAALASLDAQMTQTKTEQRQLDDQLAIKKQLEVQEKIVATLGFPVDMSRLLHTLDAVMPREMSLLDANFETLEQQVAATGTAAARATPAKEQYSVDRKLRVRLTGVAPTDVDLANFLAGLTSLPFLQQISLVRADDKTDTGHLLREFEVTFLVDLNQPAGGDK